MLVVNAELCSEEVIAFLVDFLIDRIIHRTELPVPDGDFLLHNPRRFPEVCFLEMCVLLGGAGVGFASGEAVVGVVVERVNGIGEDMVKGAEVSGEGVPVEPEDVVGVDFPDGGLDAVIEGGETGELGVGGFVEGVVAGYPGVAFVVLCEVLPEPDYTVLEVFLFPELVLARGVVGVPGSFASVISLGASCA